MNSNGRWRHIKRLAIGITGLTFLALSTSVVSAANTSPMFLGALGGMFVGFIVETGGSVAGSLLTDVVRKRGERVNTQLRFGWLY